MADRFVISRVRSLPLLAGLTQQQLESVAAAFVVVRYAAGQTIFRQGQTTQGLMLLASGSAVLLRNDQQIGTVAAGQYLNQAALYSAGVESATLRAVVDCIVLILTRDAFGALLNDPSLRAALRANAQTNVSLPPAMTPPSAPTQPAIPQFETITASGAANLPTTPVIAPSTAIAPLPARTTATAPPAFSPTPAPSNPMPTRLNPPPISATHNAPQVSVTAAQVPLPQHTPRPAKVFRGQHEDEEIKHVFRRHWWVVGRMWWLIALLATPFFVGAYFLLADANMLGFAAAILGILVPGFVAFYLYQEWQDDSIIVTNVRIVRIWNHLIGFENEISEIPLDRVIEVTVITPPGDPMARLFNYGTVYVRTAGEGANMDLNMIPNPMEVKTVIFATRDQFIDSRDQQHADAMRAELARALRGGDDFQAQSSAHPLAEPRLDAVSTHGLPFIRTKFTAPNGDLVYRRHSTVWLSHIFAPLLLLIGAGVLFVVGTLGLLPIPPIIADAIAIVLLIIGGVWFYLADWDWRNDIFRIGQDNVTLIHKRPLWMQNEIESIRIAQIDNVVSDVSGLLNNLLDRGQVRISLLGSGLNDAKVLDKVYKPEDIAAEISRRIRVVKESQRQQEIEREKNTMLQYLRLYDEMQQSGQVAPLTTRPPDPDAPIPRASTPPRPPRRGG